jgi:putative addiction module component (TIGR02574 family)
MTPKTLDELMKLSPTEREELVTPDWDDYVDDDYGFEDEFELDAEQIAELERRLAEAKANPGSGIPWSEVKRRLDALIAGE